MAWHKECKPDETWVGNTQFKDGEDHKIPEHLESMSTARLGRFAYCIEGRQLSEKYYRPIIIGCREADLYDRIMMARLKNGRCSINRNG